MTATAEPSVAESGGERTAGTAGVLLSMCMALALVAASMSAVNLALPELAVGLSASTTSLTWIVDGYALALAGLVLPFGALGDRIGRRKVLVAGTVVFGASALAAANASGTAQLVFWRAVMGVGAALVMPGTLSTITAVLPAERRPRGVALWAGCAAAGVFTGMIVSGALLEWSGWRAIFLVSAGAAVAVAVAALLLAPETRDSRRRPFDLPGAVCTALTPGALVYALIEGSDRGWTDTWVLLALAVSVLAGAAYVLLGLRSRHPLLDPRLFRIRGFQAGAVTVAVQFMVLFGFYFVGLQYIQLVLGYSPLKAGIVLVPVALVVVPTSQATPRLVRRFGVRAVMMSGLFLLGLALLAMSRLDADSGYPALLGCLVLAGFGIGTAGAVGTSAITGSLPRDQQGVASAVNDVSREVGAAVGVALMGSVFGGRYRSALPAGVSRLPAPAADAVRHSPAGGLHVADRIGPMGRALAAAVKDAFMSGMSAALAAAAVVVAVALCSLLRAPRELTPPEES